MMRTPVREEFRWKRRKKGKDLINICRHVFIYGSATATLMTGVSGIALANPSNGNVVGGSATITDTATELQINQHSDRALIEWSSFDVDKGETTRFIQPNSGSIALNRVVNSNQISSINGNLIANGRVVVINPNGVLIGADGNVDTNGFIATSADVDDDAFNNGTGSINFNRAGNIDAVVENQGRITVAESGLAALVAPTVRNSGVIQGNLAKVQLASADTFAVDFYGDGLISYAVEDGDQERTLTTDNSGEIFADGGAVLMTAADATDVVESVINSDGYIQAGSLENRGGKIVLTGSGAKVKVSGKMDVSGSGDANGGTINIGGDYQGQGDLAKAEIAEITGTAELYADGGDNGNGGDIIVWSEARTTSRGKFYARGGDESGDGGLIETSSKDILDATGTYANALAPNGKAGDWLLDPTNITVALGGVSYVGLPAAGNFTVDVATINAALANVILNATNDINFSADVDIAASGVGLSAIAGRNISVGNNSIETNNGDVLFDAVNNISINNSSFDTNGGHLTFEADGDLTLNGSNANPVIIATGGGDLLFTVGDDFSTTSGRIGTSGGDATINVFDDATFQGSTINTTGGPSVGSISVSDAGDSDITESELGPTGNEYYEGNGGGDIVITADNVKNSNNNCFKAGGTLGFCADVPDPTVDLTITIDDKQKIYGVLDPLFTWGITSGSLSGGDTLNVDLARILQGTLAGENVGNYDIFQTAFSVIGTGVYNISFINGNLQIVPASLVIKAVDQTKTYGDDLVLDGTDPSSDYTVTGLIDTINGFTTNDAVSTTDLASTGLVATADAGNYTITSANATGSGLSNYTITYQTGDLVVNKALLTVTADDKSMTYGGTAPILTDKVAGFVNGENAGVIDTSGSVASGTLFTADAGTYTDTLNSSGYADNNYNFQYVAGDLTINKADLTVSAIADSKVYDSLAYSGGNGVNITGFVNGDNVGDLGGALVYGGSSQGAINVDNYDITASGYTSNNYNIAYNDSTLDITKALLTVTANDKLMTYGGLAPTLTRTITGFVGGEGEGVIDTTGSVASGTLFTADAGTYTDTLNASGFADNNYAFQYVAGDLTINPAALLVTANNDAKIYDGLAYSGGNGVTFGGFVNGDTVGSNDLTGAVAYGGSSQGAVNAGDYVISASGLNSNNYALTYADGALSVAKALLTVTADDKSMTYGGLAPALTNTITGFVNGENAGVIDTTGTISSGTLFTADAGTYADTLNSSGYIDNNYAFQYAAGDLAINKAALSVTAVNDSKVYDGLGYTGGNGVNIVGFVNGDNVGDLSGALAYGGSSQGATNVVGSPYDIVASGYTSGNYNISYNDGQLTITPAALTITANNDVKVYDAIAYSGGNGVTYSGFVNGENENTSDLTGTIGYGGTSQGAVNVGNYGIVASGQNSSNYNITYNDGQLDITAAALLLVAANDQAKTYGDTFNFTGTEFTPTGLLGTDSVTSATITSTGAVNTANAGSHVINIGSAVGTGLGNYSISYAPGTFTVNKALLTVTADNKSMTYGGLAPTLTDQISGFVNGENAGVIDTTGSVASGTLFTADAGVYTDTLNSSGYADNNYNFQYVAGDLTIDKAFLLGITNTDSKIYDGLAYSGGNGVNYVGFLNGDDAGDLSGTLSYSGPSQGATNVGGYILSGGGQSSNNYVVAYVPNILNITPAALTVTANDQTKVYGDTFNFAGDEFTTSGLVNGETLLSATLSSLGAVNTASVAGSDYDIDISAATGGTANLANYNVTYNKGALTVNPALLTLTADDQSKTYGQNFIFNAATDFSASGLKNSDTVSSVLLVSAGAPAVANAGSYNIDISNAAGTGLSNYTIDYVDGTLTVDPAALTVTANNDFKTYDANPYSGGNGVTYAGFVNGDGALNLGGALTYGGSSQGAVNVNGSPYVISANGLTSSNYTISYVDGSLTISPRKLFVDPDDQMKIYGDADPALTFQASGLVGGDTVGTVFSGSLDRTAGENVGFYGINQGTLAVVNNNYVYGFGKADLHIKPAPLLITANDDQKVADGVAYSGGNGLTYSGFKFNDDESVIGGVINFGGSSQGAVDPGSYVIDPFGRVGARNYTITFAPGTLDITPAPFPFLEIDPLGRPIISVANQAIVLDEPFEEIETLEILTDVGISSASTGGAETLAGLEPAAGEEGASGDAQELASLEPAAGGDDQGGEAGEGEGDEFSNDIACANSFLDNKPCRVEGQ